MNAEDLRKMVATIHEDDLKARNDRLVGVLQWAIAIGRTEGRREAFEEAAIDLESRGPEGFAHAQRLRRLA